MAVATIAYKPELTAAQAEDIFRRHFQGRYKVEAWKGPITNRRDFIVIKNSFVGVSVKLEQGTNQTKFVYTGLAPKVWARLLFSGLLSLFLWNGLTNEVKQLIETAPEFR